MIMSKRLKFVDLKKSPTKFSKFLFAILALFFSEFNVAHYFSISEISLRILNVR